MRENLLPATEAPPTLVAMHVLGGSGREWNLVEELLGPDYTWAKVDLPGFGDAAATKGFSVAEMADYLANLVDRLQPRRFLLLGHSMSGKVAMAAARLAAQGDPRLAGLEGLVLSAASPAGPEPMADSKRSEMLTGLSGSGSERRSFAEKFIRDNVATPLPPEVMKQAVADVLGTDEAAWRAWLESGSREDWRERVGRLELPALVIAGDQDADLGSDAARRLVLPSLPSARLEEVRGVGHLLPLEAPEQMVSLLRRFLGELARRRAGAAAIAPSYLALIHSERVSAVTRAALLERATVDDPAFIPKALSMDELLTLRAVAKRVVPQADTVCDLAIRVDQRLARGTGKGWRYATLPADLEAYRRGLASLETAALVTHRLPLSGLTGQQIDAILTSIGSDGGPGTPAGTTPTPGLTAEQMVSWFQDLRAELAGIYVSHPATLARLGYSGIADGERSDAMTGFVEFGMGKVEAWEPQPEPLGVRQ